MSIGPAPKRSEFYSTSEYRSALRGYKALLVAEKRADKAFEKRFKAKSQKAKVKLIREEKKETKRKVVTGVGRKVESYLVGGFKKGLRFRLPKTTKLTTQQIGKILSERKARTLAKTAQAKMR